MLSSAEPDQAHQTAAPIISSGDDSSVAAALVAIEPVCKRTKLDDGGRADKLAPANNLEPAQAQDSIPSIAATTTAAAAARKAGPPAASQYRQDLRRLLAKNEELAKYFAIKAVNGGKLALLQGQCGDAPYRRHPDTIRELNEYFNQLSALLQSQSAAFNFNYAQFLRQGHLPLIAKLVQDSQKPSSELLAELKEILLPVGSQFWKLRTAASAAVEKKSAAASVESGNEAVGANEVVDSIDGAPTSADETGKADSNDPSATDAINAPAAAAANNPSPQFTFISHHFLNEFFERVNYGHPHCNTPFSAWSCTFWQVKDMDLLGPQLSRHFLTNFVVRQAARMILEGALAEDDGCEPAELTATAANKADPEATATAAAANTQPVKDTPKRKRKQSTSTANVAPGTPSKQLGPSATLSPTKPATPSTTTTTTMAASSTAATVKLPPQQPQISSFFTKLVKPAKETVSSNEYFQPFFLKPDTTLAPSNPLRSSEDAPKASPVDAELSQLRRSKYRKPRCLCVGIDGVAQEAVLKLLRFEGNYRPAYVGTWRRSCSALAQGRRPLGRVEDVDYEYDSDEEWEDGEDEEGESISDEDADEDEDEDEDDMLSSNESEDSWLVPHGYLSDDEGVDEVHPGELEEQEAMAMPPPQPQSKKRSKKFIPKEPIILGPFLAAQDCCSGELPDLIRASVVQFVDLAWERRDPFEAYIETVFADLTSKESAVAKSTGKEFPEVLLPSLIKIVSENQTAGIVKLYDEFTLAHGKGAASKRAFESKLNQITLGKQKCETTGKMTWIFKEGIVVSGESVDRPCRPAIATETTVSKESFRIEEAKENVVLN